MLCTPPSQLWEVCFSRLEADIVNNRGERVVSRDRLRSSQDARIAFLDYLSFNRGFGLDLLQEEIGGNMRIEEERRPPF
jgi:hypothetical protein